MAASVPYLLQYLQSSHTFIHVSQP